MLRIRLQRRGKRNYATYRVVIADRRAPVKGRFVADVGHYNPHTDTFKVNKEAVTDWITKGALPTPTVHNLLVTHSIIKGDKLTSWRPKKKEAGESDSETASKKPAADASAEAPPAGEDNDETPAETETPPEEKPDESAETEESKKA